MNSADYQEALRLIREHPEEADFEGEQPEELVALAEQKLGLAFPEPYRSFLRDLGCGDFAGDEVFGIIDANFDASAVPDAVWFTEELRKDASFPKDLIAIGEMAEGEIIALDAGKKSPSAGAVFLVTLEETGNASSRELIAGDFGEYFLSLVREALQED